MRQLFLPVLLVLVFIGAVVFATQKQTTPKKINFYELQPERVSSDKGTKEYLLINDQETWRKVAFRHGLKDDISSDLFTKRTIVAAFYGTAPTAGYDIKISKIESQGGVIKVYITETSPGNDCMTAQILTAPVHLVVTDEKIDGNVQFVVSPKVVSCK
jgi:hypothetical protein